MPYDYIYWVIKQQQNYNLQNQNSFIFFSVQHWIPPPPPPPPTQYYLGYAYACSLPLKAPPYLRTDKISEPPFAGFSQDFPALETPLNPKHMLNVPPYILFYNPLFKFLRRPKRQKEKPPPFLKKSPGEKSNTPLFYNSRAGLCRTKSTQRFWEHACGPSDPGVGGPGIGS